MKTNNYIKHWVEKGCNLNELQNVLYRSKDFISELGNLDDIVKHEVAASVLHQIGNKLPETPKDIFFFPLAMNCLNTMGINSGLEVTESYINEYVERNEIKEPYDQYSEISELANCLASMRTRAAGKCIVLLMKRLDIWEDTRWYGHAYYIKCVAECNCEDMVLELMRAHPKFWRECAKAFKYIRYSPVDKNDLIRIAVAEEDWDRVREFGNVAVNLLVEALQSISFGENQSSLDHDRKALCQLIGEFGVPEHISTAIADLDQKIMGWHLYCELANLLHHPVSSFKNWKPVEKTIKVLENDDIGRENFPRYDFWPWIDHYAPDSGSKICALFLPFLETLEGWGYLVAAAAVKTARPAQSINPRAIIFPIMSRYAGKELIVPYHPAEVIKDYVAQQVPIRLYPEHAEKALIRVGIDPVLISLCLDSVFLHHAVQGGGTDDKLEQHITRPGELAIMKLARRRERIVDDILTWLCKLPDTTGGFTQPGEPAIAVSVSMETRRKLAQEVLEKRQRSLNRKIENFFKKS